MFMKYKRISTKDYLVNENQFIELLENKALEGWYLKNISLNFLTFEKRTPQRKHSAKSGCPVIGQRLVNSGQLKRTQ